MARTSLRALRLMHTADHSGSQGIDQIRSAIGARSA